MRTFGPDSWTALPLPEPVAAVAADGPALTAALLDGQVMRSLDGGGTWRSLAQVADLPTTLLPVPGALLVGTVTGLRRVDHDDAPPHGPAGVVTALTGQGGVVVVALLRAGVYRSEDGGARWEAAGEGLPHDGTHLHVFAAVPACGELVIAHPLGVSRSRDGGRSWTPAGTGLPFQMPFATLAADGAVLYAGVNGRLYRTPTGPDGAAAWREVYDGIATGRPLDLLGSDGGILYAATHEAPHLVASTDGGGSWTSVADGFPSPPVGLAVGGAWLVGLAWDGTLWRAPRPQHQHPRAPDPRAPARRAPAETALALDVRSGGPDAPVRLAFVLAAPAVVRLTIHDLLDREVAAPVDGPQAAGRHAVDLAPGTLPPGLYRARLHADGRLGSASFAVLGGRL